MLSKFFKKSYTILQIIYMQEKSVYLYNEKSQNNEQDYKRSTMKVLSVYRGCVSQEFMTRTATLM